MGHFEDFHWDDQKSELLVESRGYTLLEVAKQIFSKDYIEYQHTRYPDQSRVIGMVGGKLITLVYEIVDDNYRYFIKLITYWPASKLEKNIYNREIMK